MYFGGLLARLPTWPAGENLDKVGACFPGGPSLPSGAPNAPSHDQLLPLVPQIDLSIHLKARTDHKLRTKRRGNASPASVLRTVPVRETPEALILRPLTDDLDGARARQ